MLIEAHVLQVAKDNPTEYEDASHFDSQSGFAAIADGVSNALFSGIWARLLVRSLVETPPGPIDGAGLTQWLAPHRETWLKEIDFPNLDPRQKRKLVQDGGAFCTLCWLQVAFDASTEDGNPFSFTAYGIGDSCLFVVRESLIQQSFPLARSEEFDLNPESVCSVNLNRDQLLSLRQTSGRCCSEDWLVLCTDAVACWLLHCHEQGIPIDWSAFWEMSDSDWATQVEGLRSRLEIKRDDSTLVLIRPRFEAEPAEISEPAAATNCDGASDEPAGDSAPVNIGANDAHQGAPVDETTRSATLGSGTSSTSQTEPAETVTSAQPDVAAVNDSVSEPLASAATGLFSRMASWFGVRATQGSQFRSGNECLQDERS